MEQQELNIILENHKKKNAQLPRIKTLDEVNYSNNKRTYNYRLDVVSMPDRLVIKSYPDMQYLLYSHLMIESKNHVESGTLGEHLRNLDEYGITTIYMADIAYVYTRTRRKNVVTYYID